MRRSTRNLILALPLLWITLSLGSGLAHWYAWKKPDQVSGATGDLDRFCKLVGNASQTINGPFWIVAWYGLQRYTSFTAAFIVNTIGFGFWIGALGVVLFARHRLRRPRPPTLSEKTELAAPEAPLPRPALSRRAFLTDSTLVAGVACAGGVGAYGSFVTPWSLRVVRYTVPITGLPAALRGLRLVQITDTHLGPRIPASFVSESVELALSLRPDVVLLTGDYIHMGHDYIRPAAQLFRPLTQKHPGRVLGVLGNHDHYANPAAVANSLADIGVRMIDSRRVFLDAISGDLAPIARRAECLCIAGVDDLLEGVVDVPAAFRDVPAEVPRILLSHNPDVAELPDLASHRVDLMISGHTHGGQVRIPFLGTPGIPSHYGQKYAHGLVQGPHCPVIISAGVGMSLVPVRISVPPEIVEITLEQA